MNLEQNKAFVLDDAQQEKKSSQDLTPENFASMRKKIISIRATKRILAPYVKARKRPKEITVENKHFSFYIQKKPSILMKVMTKWSLAADLLAVMTETVQVLGEITKSTSATVYMVDDSMGEIYQVIESYEDNETHASTSRSICEKPRICYKIETSTTVAAHVAYTKEIIKLDDLLEDIRFPGGLGNNEVTVKSVLCVPVLSPDNECLAVFELYRDMDHDTYDDGDLSIVILMSSWIGSTIYHNQQLVTLRKQHELTGYLLQLTECYFDDAKLLDKLISEIVNFAKVALEAESAMFYVLKPSEEQQEIYVDEYADRPYTENLCKTKNVEIMGTSQSKADLINLLSDANNIVNIKHSTNDFRMRREQRRIKNKIRCLIATAIKCSNQALGVMELFNKKDGPFFTKSDEILLKTFSDYCGLVLKFAQEYEGSRKVEKLNDTYESLLNKNLVGCIHDSLFVISQSEIPSVPDRFNHFDFYLPEAYDMYAPQLIMYMLDKLNPQMFRDKASQAEFVLAIKKAFSDLPYHNFEHGFHVCHCMYNILSRCNFFNTMEITALMVAAYCHGIDHKGVTNSFLKMSEHPLATLYSDNFLENHYFFVAKMIIQHLNVFSHMPANDYKLLMSKIKTNILSTTLTNCLHSVKQLTAAYKRSDFNLTKSDNRVLLQSVIMCMALFSNLCKPFSITRSTVHSMYDENYSLGDKIKTMGFSCIPLFDREKENMMAQDQMTFISGIVLPCAHTLSKFVPTCDLMYTNAMRVRDAWEEVWLTQGQKLWSLDDSIPKTKKY